MVIVELRAAPPGQWRGQLRPSEGATRWFGAYGAALLCGQGHLVEQLERFRCGADVLRIGLHHHLGRYDLHQFHDVACLLLLGLGLIDQTAIKDQDPNWPAYKKYFMHGTSHHLGLDVHDVGTMHYPITAGMVFTVEPGIYIPEEGFGVRLENNIVIQENGYFDLMRNIPIEAEEIESLMNS
jgi:hypothetical protein